MSRTLVCVAVTCLVGCAAPRAETTPAAEPTRAAAPRADAPPTGATLYARLGGQPAIEQVIGAMLTRVFADERLAYEWAGSDLPRVHRRLVELVCAATGGGCTYSGRDMKTVHRGLVITGAQFDLLVGHLVEALDEAKVPEREKGELLGLLAPMRSDIVTEAP